MAATESAYVATSSFAVFVGDTPRVVNKGDMVAADDPLVSRGSPQRGLFEPVSDFIRTQTAPSPTIRPEPEVVEPEPAPSRRSRRNQPEPEPEPVVESVADDAEDESPAETDDPAKK